MDILLVEDCVADAARISEVCRQLGHRVVGVANEDAARRYYVESRPDLVIAGVGSAGVGGFALARAVRALAAPHWQPVIFVSDECDEVLRARALEAGGDACFGEPVCVGAFTARLRDIEQLLTTQRDAESRRVQLERYLAAEEEDRRIARHLIERRLAGDSPRPSVDPAVGHWHLPCGGLGGDLLSFCRAPNGTLHVMLADASDCGLAAYVTLLPIIAPFYRMTEKGFPLPTIVRELNLKVRQSLPPDRVVAAQLTVIDAREGVVGVWNGGMPAAFMLDGSGQGFREFVQTHPPLGALDNMAFDDRVEQHVFVRGEQLAMVSDGLLDAVGQSGKCSDERPLAEVLACLPRDRRLVEASAMLTAHLDGRAPSDDLSLVLIDCEKDAASPVALQPRMPRDRHPGNWRFSLDLGANELGRFDVVPLLLNVADQFNATHEHGGELFVILSELFNNALDHGILHLDSRLKLSPDGMEAWLKMREERLMALTEGEIVLSVEQLIESGRPWLRIRCRDSGSGFDVHSTLRRACPEASGAMPHDAPVILPFGRGLTLVQHMAHGLDFNEAGNEVTVLLALEENAPTGCPVL